MYRLFALVLGMMPLMAAQLHVDHVTVAGRDLRAMRHAFEAAGLKDEYGGLHANHATEMALSSFPDGSYLELIAIQPQADPAAVKANQWHGCLEGDGGPCGWAVRPTDLSAEAVRLRAAGVTVTMPVRAGRKRPDGVELQWETAQVGSGNGNFYPFLIHDFTPRERRAYPGGKPTTTDFTGIVRVVLGVRNLDAAIALYRHAYGFGSPQTQDDPAFGAKLAWFADSPVILAAPDNAQSWLAARLRKFGETPCAFILGAAKNPPSSKTTWFGKPVAWLAPETLGWRLGVE